MVAGQDKPVDQDGVADEGQAESTSKGVEGEGDGEQAAEPQTHEQKEQSKAMDKITDVGERETLNESKVHEAMGKLGQARDRAAAKQREKELSSVKVSKEDIEVITTEMEVDRKVAERRLREHGGNLRNALLSFIQ